MEDNKGQKPEVEKPKADQTKQAVINKMDAVKNEQVVNQSTIKK